MSISNHTKSLYRSPLKTVLTLLLLAVTAFMFLYNLSEYSVSDREYQEACEYYQGVLTVEELSVPDNASSIDFFLLTDETERTRAYGLPFFEDGLDVSYDNNHQKSLEDGMIEKLSKLPYITRVEKRYLTAGVSADYMRLDTDKNMYPYSARCIITATVKSRFLSALHNNWALTSSIYPEIEAFEYLIIEDAEMLAGNPSWFVDAAGQHLNQHAVYLQIIKDEYREKATYTFNSESTKRLNMFTTENLIYIEDVAALQPGRCYLMILRNNSELQGVSTTTEYQDEYPSGYYHLFNVGDDSLIGWWPYFVDITDLPDNWLEMDEFADLRELIRVTNDDVHTFDIIYGDDMSAHRRVAEGRVVCEEGRFLTPADAGQPVCVVSTAFLETYGLKVGDSITLDLGNYLSEQYAPLGAVAVTRGRQNTAYTQQSFTIIGTWRDLNEGNHPFRDLYWCWSNNAIFVPSSFLPECTNAENHTFKPSEISFVIDNPENIASFEKECLPLLDEMGINYKFSDGGWQQIGQNLIQSRKEALVKLVIFSAAAVFALILTTWLFIGRKKRDYAIFRALGMPKGEASNRLYIPFLLLGFISTLLGFAGVRIVVAQQLATETAHSAENVSLFLCGALGFFILLAIIALIGLLLIRRRSILSLLQGKHK